MKIVTQSIQDILKELSKLAEDEIEKELYRVALDAIDSRKADIIQKVRKNYTQAVSTTLVQAMDHQGMRIEFSFKPKNESVEVKGK